MESAETAEKDINMTQSANNVSVLILAELIST